MNTFLLTSAAIVAVAILLLAPTLLRSRHKAAEDTREDNIRIARERLTELEKEKTKGDLSDEEFAQARQDLEIALAQDLSTASSRTRHSDNKGTARLTLVIVAVAIPIIVTLTYQQIGSPEHLHVAGPGKPAVVQQQQQKLPPISDLVSELARRLEAEPNNPQGWFLLGRTYMKMQRYSEAAQAYERLNEFLPDNPTAMVSWADALSMANGGQVPEKAVALLDKVLAVEPEAVSALWLAGNAAAQRGQDQKALDYWGRAIPLLDEEPAMQQELRGMIAQIEQRSGLKADIPAPLPDIMSAAAEPSAPVADDAIGEGLQVEVALDAELMDMTSPDDSVFIYAKAAAGPPMPLAVARMRVADLPVKVALNDSMAMMPQMKLSNFERVLVGARVSKSGQATPQPGDLQSMEVETASDSNDPVQLVINQQRP